MNIKIVFMVIAAICFGIKASGISTGQIDMTALGFMFVTIAFIV